MYRSQKTKIQYYELRRTDAEIPKDGRPEYDLLRDYQTPRDSTRDDFLLFFLWKSLKPSGTGPFRCGKDSELD